MDFACFVSVLHVLVFFYYVSLSFVLCYQYYVSNKPNIDNCILIITFNFAYFFKYIVFEENVFYIKSSKSLNYHLIWQTLTIYFRADVNSGSK